MKRRNEAVYSSIEQAVCIFILSFFVLFSVVSGNYEKNTEVAMLGEINEGWIDEDGQTVDLYDLAPGIHSVTLDISELNTDGKAICFKTIDTTFKVYASDELIYEYNPELPSYLGVSYGMQYHTIAIPEGSTSLNLYIEPVFTNTPAGIGEITIDAEGRYMTLNYS